MTRMERIKSIVELNFKISKSTLCGYSDGYRLVKGTKTVPNTRTAAPSNRREKKYIFKYCASFTDFINKISNTQVDNAKDINIVMPMYNLIEYSNYY